MKITNILVVEDDELLKPILARVLYSIDDGLSLKWVGNATDARDALSRDIYDLVISDVLLDGNGTGLELYQHCGTYYPDTLVLIISGLSKETLEEYLGSAIDPQRYLSKPIALGQCRQSIVNLIQRKNEL